MNERRTDLTRIAVLAGLAGTLIGIFTPAFIFAERLASVESDARACREGINQVQQDVRDTRAIITTLLSRK